MWQDLCVAAGHACRLAALVVQGSSTTAAMAEYGPVYSTFGERKRGLFMAEKCRKLWGCWNTIFTQFDFSIFQSFSDLPKTLENIQWKYTDDAWCMMDFCQHGTPLYLKKCRILSFMAYTNDVLECVWRELCLSIGPPWATFESGMDDAAFFFQPHEHSTLLRVADIGMQIYHGLFCSKGYHLIMLILQLYRQAYISYTYITCFCNILLNIIYPFQSFCDES